MDQQSEPAKRTKWYIIGGVLGMLLATRLSAYKNILNRRFAALIFVVAAYILYRNWGTSMIG